MIDNPILDVIISDSAKTDEKSVLTELDGTLQSCIMSDGTFKWFNRDIDRKFKFILIHQYDIYDDDEFIDSGIDNLAKSIGLSGKRQIIIYFHKTGAPTDKELSRELKNKLGNSYLISETTGFSHVAGEPYDRIRKCYKYIMGLPYLSEATDPGDTSLNMRNDKDPIYGLNKHFERKTIDQIRYEILSPITALDILNQSGVEGDKPAEIKESIRKEMLAGKDEMVRELCDIIGCDEDFKRDLMSLLPGASGVLPQIEHEKLKRIASELDAKITGTGNQSCVPKSSIEHRFVC